MTYASEVLADTPLAYYRLGEASGTTLVDSSGNARDGTYAGSPTLGAASLLVSDPSNTAVSFDGVNDIATVASATWQQQAVFTVDALVSPTSGDTFIGRRNTAIGTDNAWALRLAVDYPSAGQNRLYAILLNVAVGSTNLIAASSITLGSTYHVALTYDGTNAKIYVNGALDGTLAIGALNVASGSKFTIGAILNSSTWTVGFGGKVDEVAYYGTALSATRILAHYNAGIAATAMGAVALVATSTLTTTAIDTALPTVALVATSSLAATAAGAGALSATASLAATSSLTATATIARPAVAALVASSTLTPTMAPATVVSLSAASSLTANAATPVAAAVALSATSTLTIAGTVIVSGVVSLGAVTVAVGPVTALDMAQPGTLANPYAASDSDTRSLDFASALFVATEPVAVTGPPAAPSIWYEFTESQVADWLASTSSFTNGATIELYMGPPGAGPDDLTFIATDGSSLVTLGAVTVSALATIVASPLQAELVSLGAVAVAASPAVAVVLS